MIVRRFRGAATGLLTAALVVLPVSQATALPAQTPRSALVTIDCGGLVIKIAFPTDCNAVCQAKFIAEIKSKIQMLCSRP
ncbi:hypothetical protein ACFC1R_35365 [Kitasatospora sp. NPDC056138]|uniref:hypothetical protein n=1 Tax=Kitasatospora sp. NPDC056138 TaxID=3345724 RepID=UPI0035D90DBC